MLPNILFFAMIAVITRSKPQCGFSSLSLFPQSQNLLVVTIYVSHSHCLPTHSICSEWQHVWPECQGGEATIAMYITYTLVSMRVTVTGNLQMFPRPSKTTCFSQQIRVRWSLTVHTTYLWVVMMGIRQSVEIGTLEFRKQVSWTVSYGETDAIDLQIAQTFKTVLDTLKPRVLSSRRTNVYMFTLKPMTVISLILTDTHAHLHCWSVFVHKHLRTSIIVQNGQLGSKGTPVTIFIIFCDCAFQILFVIAVAENTVILWLSL